MAPKIGEIVTYRAQLPGGSVVECPALVARSDPHQPDLVVFVPEVSGKMQAEQRVEHHRAVIHCADRKAQTWESRS